MRQQSGYWKIKSKKYVKRRLDPFSTIKELVDLALKFAFETVLGDVVELTFP